MRFRTARAWQAPAHARPAQGDCQPSPVPAHLPHGSSPGARRRRGGLLWHRNFRALWAGETISGAGSAMAAVVVPVLAVTALRASAFTVAALTAAAYLPWLVAGLPAGAWVDRLPARPVMITCDLISALAYASLPAAAWAGMLTTGQVLAVALLGGTANVAFATAYQVLLPSLVTAGELVEANAKLQGSASVAAIAGRGAAGLAAEAAGAAAALLFNSASFLVSALCLLRIRTSTGRRHREHPGTVRAEIAQGLAFIARDPYLRPLTAYAAAANLAYSGATALVVVFLIRVAGFGPPATGLLLAGAGTGAAAGAAITPRLARWLGTARTLLLSALAAGLFSLLIPLTEAGPRAAFYLVGAGMASGAIAAGNIIAGSFRQAYCPAPLLGRVTAGMRFLVFGAIPLGSLLAGALATTLGTRNALWVILTGYALSAALLLTPATLADKNLPSAATYAHGERPRPPCRESHAGGAV